MNRKERRSRMAHCRKLARKPWEALERKPLTPEQREWPESLGNFVDGYLNNVVSVQVYERTTAWGQVQHLAVRRHDGEEIAGWDMLQLVKNEVAGPGATALEVYPPQSELLDKAPMRHLFVLPSGFVLPLTIHGRWV